MQYSTAATAFFALSISAAPAASASAISTQSNPVNQIVVWDGEGANLGAGSVSYRTSPMGPQTREAHSGNTSLEFRCAVSERLCGFAWNWTQFGRKANAGTDTTSMKRLSFWIKTKGHVSGTLRLSLDSKDDNIGTTQAESVRVEVLNYCPKAFDGDWHEVAIPLSDLNKSRGFNPRNIYQLELLLVTEKGADVSFFLDDIAFDNYTGDQ